MSSKLKAINNENSDVVDFPKKVKRTRRKQSKFKRVIKNVWSKIDGHEIATVVIGVVLAEITYDLLKFLFLMIF